MHPSLLHVAHRPWPIPERPWTWRQTWRDLLFAHWRIDAAQLRRHIPSGLTLQEFDGSAWIGVVPFRMTGVMHRPLPDLPWISAFPELNVRTYVERDGKAGVWFFSLDATNPLAVWAARKFFHLPYVRARMSLTRDGEGVVYRSERVGADARFRGSYAPTTPVYRSESGSLDHWLTERYCLFAEDGRGRLIRNDIHHAPWPLQKARAAIEINTMLSPIGLSVEGPPPLLHFAERIDVIVWSGERV